MSQVQHNVRIPAQLAGRRLDQALAELLPDYSRSRLSQWLRGGQIRINGRVARPRDKVGGGEAVALLAELAPPPTLAAEDIPLTLVHEDADLLVVNKPAGLVVHPAAGNPDGTLLNALLHHAPELAGLPRAGIVHRLDKDTTGLLVVARNLAAHHHLVDALAARAIRREYLALVLGEVSGPGRVETLLGRHPQDRKRMAVLPPGSRRGKPALTHYRIVRRLPGHTLLGLRLETGRTHQIRVHMAHLRHPIVGDPVYGGRSRYPRGASADWRLAVDDFARQALHATRLQLTHPGHGGLLQFEAPLPADFAGLLELLQARCDHP